MVLQIAWPWKESLEVSKRKKQYSLEVSGIVAEVVRKNIKNLRITIYPPHGLVRVSAPVHVSDKAVYDLIESRLSWIRRKQNAFRKQPAKSQHEMMTGESHYYQGRRYRLEVVEVDRPPSVILSSDSTIELRVRPGTDRNKRESVLNEWYRKQLKEHVPPLIAQWEPRLGVEVSDWGIRSMKTRWGTCNISAKRVWLNLELAKKPPSCLEYVLVHEMLHLVERHHNERFRKLMDDLIPQWRLREEELNHKTGNAQK